MGDIPAAGPGGPPPPPAELARALDLNAVPAADDPKPAEAAPGGAAPAGEAAPGGAAPGPQPAPPPSDAKRAAAEAVAGLIVNGLAAGIARQWPAAQFKVDEKTAAAAVLVPVMLKYGLTPEWLERYREEIALGVTWGGLAYVGYSRVRAARTTPPPASDGIGGLGPMM